MRHGEASRIGSGHGRVHRESHNLPGLGSTPGRVTTAAGRDGDLRGLIRHQSRFDSERCDSTTLRLWVFLWLPRVNRFITATCQVGESARSFTSSSEPSLYVTTVASGGNGNTE